MKRLGEPGLGTEQPLLGSSPATSKSPAPAHPESQTTPFAQPHQGLNSQMSPRRCWGGAQEEVGLEPSGLGDYIAMGASGDYMSVGGSETKAMGLPERGTSLTNATSSSQSGGDWDCSEYISVDWPMPESLRNSCSMELQHRVIRFPFPGIPTACNDRPNSSGSPGDVRELTDPQVPEPAGEYVSIEGPNYIAMEASSAEETPTAKWESDLNYVDLDLRQEEGQNSQVHPLVLSSRVSPKAMHR